MSSWLLPAARPSCTPGMISRATAIVRATSQASNAGGPGNLSTETGRSVKTSQVETFERLR